MKRVWILLLLVCLSVSACKDVDVTGEKAFFATVEEVVGKMGGKFVKFVDGLSESVSKIYDKVTTVNRITGDVALAVALGDAGCAKGDVILYKNYLCNDNGSVYYDIEFKNAENMFEYEVDSVNGNILKKEINSLK